MCEARRAKARSQGGHRSCTLCPGTETKPHGDAEMGAPENQHSAMVRKSPGCSPVAARPRGQPPRLGPAAAPGLSLLQDTV